MKKNVSRNTGLSKCAFLQVAVRFPLIYPSSIWCLLHLNHTKKQAVGGCSKPEPRHHHMHTYAQWSDPRESRWLMVYCQHAPIKCHWKMILSFYPFRMQFSRTPLPLYIRHNIKSMHSIQSGSFMRTIFMHAILKKANSQIDSSHLDII